MRRFVADFYFYFYFLGVVVALGLSSCWSKLPVSTVVTEVTLGAASLGPFTPSVFQHVG